ncbi:MAG: restriction endonuclease subunit S [Flavobacteriales bacterium]|nr:restriction endonuclease subunit S [Flavobacteriales bacterium]
MSKLNKILPDGWRSKKFGDVFQFISSATFSRDDLSSESKGIGVCNIHYGDIHSTFSSSILDCTKEQLPEITKENVDQAKLQFLREGDLVIADASEDYESIGSSVELQNVNGQKITAGLHTFAARDKANDTSIGFRSYLFKHPWVGNELKKLATGSKVYGISKTNLSSLELVLPPLPEQQKIARILRTWDELIDQQTKLIDAKERQKKGLMQKLLSGELRFPGFEGEWETVKLGEILSIGSGKDYKHLVQGDIPVYGTGGLMTYVNDYLFDGDSVCIGRKGTIDAPQFLTGKFWTVDTLFYTHSFKNALPKYIFYVSQTINWKKYNEASGIPSLSKSTIQEIQIILPSIEEQRHIERLLSRTDAELQLLNNELKYMKHQKTGMMQQLLTGKVRVNDC